MSKTKKRAKPLQRKFKTTFLSILWPPGNGRGHLYQKDELCWLVSKKKVSKENPHGVGDDLAVVVDPDSGAKMLVRLFGAKHAVEVSKSTVKPCHFGSLHPDTKAVGGGYEWRFVKGCKGGAMLTKKATQSAEKSAAENNKSAAENNKSAAENNKDQVRACVCAWGEGK